MRGRRHERCGQYEKDHGQLESCSNCGRTAKGRQEFGQNATPKTCTAQTDGEFW